MHATGQGGASGGGGGSWRLPPDETLQVADPKTKEDDLGYGGDGHNWRSIIFSLMVIGMVIAGIVTAIYLLGYVDELLYWSGRRMRLEELLRGELTAERLPATWVDGTRLVYQADDGGLAVLDTSSNQLSTLVTNHTLRQLNVRGYQCSSNLRYVIFQHNIKEVYRQTTTALYTVYDVTNDHHMPVRIVDSPRSSRTRFQHVSWLGPNGALLMVADNDIYARPGPPGPDSEKAYFKLTSNGSPGLVYNGIPDWLYQEEISRQPFAIWGSPNGSFVLYVEFDDRAVGTFSYPWLSTGSIGLGSRVAFPESRTIRYPTPGTTNPTVKLWIVTVENKTDPRKWEVKPPYMMEGQDYYLTSANWVGQENLYVAAVWMNRAQNLTVVSACMPPNWTCVETHTERAAEQPWLDIPPHPVYSPDGSSFLLLAGVREAGGQHYTHIKHITTDRRRMAVLSHGKIEVTDILAWDFDNHFVYYLGCPERQPGQRHLYIARDPNAPASATGDPRRDEPACVSCGSGPLWHSRMYYANCSEWNALVPPPSTPGGNGVRQQEKGVRNYALICQGPGPPLGALHNAQTHQLERLLFDTRPHRSVILSSLALPSRRSFDVTLGSGARARIQLLLPPSWREELRDAAFPVLVQVDGRPGSAQVSEKFTVDWGTYMSSRNDVVYVKLDVAGARGMPRSNFNKKLGVSEVSDQLAAIRYLLDTLKFLDETRVGVWGWGYGGYVTAMLLGSQQRILKCGIAVSPISDWLYYNSAFTERILGTPSENYKAYVEADATQRARHVPSHSFYLLHGLADQTAPYRHGAALAQALSEAGVMFRYQSYADEGHYLAGVLEHVYRSMEDFLRECLSLDPEESKPPAPDS